MTALLDQPAAPRHGAAGAPYVPVAPEATVRRSLRAQIARLEAELVAMPAGRASVAPPAGAARGARLHPLGELERIRDDLVRRIQERRFDGGAEQERRRRLREEMWLAPHAHRGVTVANAEVGEPGCTRWASWFRLTVSSGCP